MGEYQEDFNDLLESDSDDEADKKQTDDNLLSLDDVVISDNSGEKRSKTLDFMLFLPEPLDEDEDEDDDSVTGRHKSGSEEDFKLELEKRRNLQRMHHSVPPGIDLFRFTSVFNIHES